MRSEEKKKVEHRGRGENREKKMREKGEEKKASLVCSQSGDCRVLLPSLPSTVEVAYPEDEWRWGVTAGPVAEERG